MRNETDKTRFRRGFLMVTVAALGVLALGRIAQADETLRVGKAVAQAFSFVPLDVGMEIGIFKKHGLKIEEYAFGGAAKYQQAMAARSIDIGLGGGTDLAFIVKGSPVLAVAAMAGPPSVLVLAVRKEGPIHTVKDLKGKTIGVSTAGSLTDWLVRELSRRQGWGPNGIEIAQLGAPRSQIAALKTGQIDGVVTDIGGAYRLEGEGAVRILVKFGDLVKDFHIHVIYATREVIDKRPDVVRRFLAGWFEAIAFMRKHKDETVKIATRVNQISAEIADRVYVEVMPTFSNDGRFNPAALDVLAQSFVDVGTLAKKPDMRALYTEKFLPWPSSNTR